MGSGAQVELCLLLGPRLAPISTELPIALPALPPPSCCAANLTLRCPRRNQTVVNGTQDQQPPRFSSSGMSLTA